MGIQGAIYFNGFFPGHIDLPENTAYTVHLGDLQTMLCIVRHRRPIVVTDFRNEFVPPAEHPKGLLGIRLPIPVCPPEQVSADFTTHRGESGPGFLCTKDHDFVVYRKQPFTEITVGTEVEDLNNPKPVTGRIFTEAIERLLIVYRTVTQDVLAVPPSRQTRNVPVIRTQKVGYQSKVLAPSAMDRLTEHIPNVFVPEVYSVVEGAHDTPKMPLTQQQAAKRVGHHLAVKTEVSSAQRALTDAYEVALLSKNFRFTLLEAVSVAEFAAFDLVNSLRLSDQDLDQRLKKSEDRGNLSYSRLIKSFLPQLLAGARQNFPDLISNLDQARKKRNRILHRREGASRDEALAALRTAQELVFSIETSRQAAD